MATYPDLGYKWTKASNSPSEDKFTVINSSLNGGRYKYNGSVLLFKTWNSAVMDKYKKVKEDSGSFYCPFYL